MDWFQRITGFAEGTYEQVQRQLQVEGEYLVSSVNGSRHAIGRFETPTLAQLRQRVGAQALSGPRCRVRSIVGDARQLHADPALREATFQVASQFNALEMTGPQVRPEDGVTRYQFDPTQGPACAIAAGAATIWRNYFLPLGDATGQTAQRQLDTLAGLGQALAARLGVPVARLWRMQNGYALAHADGLQAIAAYLQGASEAERDALRATLAVAVQRGAEVTDLPAGQRHRVTQVFCSALPVAYAGHPASLWAPFAQLVLEAAYEATLLAALQLRLEGGAPTVLLTRLGGGAFGNAPGWIDAALNRALHCAAGAGLEVLLVSYGSPHPSHAALQRQWAG